MDRFVDVMGDEQHRRAMAGAKVEQQCLHTQPGQCIERTEGLVEQEQLGLAHQRAGQRRALLLAAGELHRPGLSPRRQFDLGEGVQGTLARRLAFQPERDIVDDALPGQQARILEDHRDRVGDAEPTGAADAMIEPGERPQEGALAGTGAAEQSDELAAADVEIDIVDDGALAIAAGEAAHRDDGRLGQSARILRHGRAFRVMKRTSQSELRPSAA